MGTWVGHMQQSPHAPIVDLGKRIEKKCDEATLAIQTAEKAETSSREFRLTGARRQIIDRFNALGKATEGDLKKMPHAHPELHLPNTFSERFLRAGRPVVPPTVEELKAKCDGLKEELAQAQAELDAAEKAEQEAAAETVQRERAQNEKKLTQAQAELDKKAKEVADLKEKLKEPPPS